MTQSGWAINCNFTICLLSVFHKHNRQAHTEMQAKYDSSVEGTHSFLPSCSPGTRGKVWCGHFLKFVQSSPSKNPRKLFPLPCECSTGEGKISPVWRADQTLCLILCIEAVNSLSIKSDWWVLKRWCLLTTIFTETKACISYFFVKTGASLVLKYTKYLLHYLNSQNKVSTDVW